MARDGFTCSEIFAFAEALQDADKGTQKKVKKLLRDEGTKLRRKTAQLARVRVRKQAVHRKGIDRAAGTYYKSIKRGKVYYRGKAACIRVYSTDAVAHLMEYVWRPKARDGSRGQFQRGRKVFNDSRDAFMEEFNEAVENLADEVIQSI